MVRVLKGLSSFSLLFLIILFIFPGCFKGGGKETVTSPASTDVTAVTKEPAGRLDGVGVSFIKFAIQSDELNKLSINDFGTLSQTSAASFYNLYGTAPTGDDFADFVARLNTAFFGKASHSPIEVVFLSNDVEIQEVIENAGLPSEFKLFIVENIQMETKVLFNMDQGQFRNTQGTIKYLSFRADQIHKVDDTHFDLVPTYYLFATRNDRFNPEYKADFRRAAFNGEYFRVSKRSE
ncbi:MAG TPA: hypothetical protein VJB34_04705 [Bdellovibrionota bacterium]|nr:hypothetical protein [Bdellovibrionota bacterium]